jgi:hypothetical protein
MGDAGEGLIDAEARFQERLAEREEERRRAAQPAKSLNPEKQRILRSLTLARADLRRQRERTESPVRLQQIDKALSDIERKLAAL